MGFESPGANSGSVSALKAAEGLYLPNPQALGLTFEEPNLDLVSPNPPIISAFSAGNAASALPNPQEWAACASSSTLTTTFRFFGWPTTARSTGGFSYAGPDPSFSFTLGVNPTMCDYFTDALVHEIETKGQTAGFLTLRCDGKLAFDPRSPISAPSANSQKYRLPILAPGVRTVADAVTNTDTSLTSATAAFTSTDVGCEVIGAGIRPGTTIASVTNGTTVVLSLATTATATGVTIWIGRRQIHHYELDMASNWLLWGICTTKADSVTTSKKPLGPRIFWQGDSFPEGSTGRTTRFTAYPFRSSRLMGMKDCWYVGVGGTGMINNGGGTNGKTTVILRMNADVYTRLSTTRPNVIVLSDLGHNDDLVTNGYTAAQVTAATTALLADIHTNAPNAIVIIDAYWTPGTASASVLTTKAAVLAGVLAAPTGSWSLYIDSVAGTWTAPGGRTGGPAVVLFSGTGKLNSPTSDGNADVCKWTDGTHPTDAGDQAFSTFWVSCIRDGLLLGTEAS